MVMCQETDDFIRQLLCIFREQHEMACIEDDQIAVATIW